MLKRAEMAISAREAIDIAFNPAHVAFIGASTSVEKPSGQPIRNLWNSAYGGSAVGVNARGESIEGRATYKTIGEVAGSIDLGFVTVPAPACAGAIRELGEKGAKVAVLAVGGFAELGTEEGRRLAEDIIRAGKDSGVRIIGPICNGLYSTPNSVPLGYNALHTRRLEPGQVALVSHSGALVSPFVNVLESCNARLSRYVGTGSEVDLGLSDFVDYLADDPQTSVIALILDHAGPGDRFRAAVRRARQAGKEIVALKLGNTDLGRSATLAHSSHLSGTRHVYDAVFAEEGIRSVPTLETLALTCAALSNGKAPKSGGVVACSTSGGGAILLADLLSEQIERTDVVELSPATLARIGAHLRFDASSIMNPFDLGLGGRHHYEANILSLAEDQDCAVLLVFGTPMATRAKREQLAGAVTAASRARPDVPVIYLSPSPLVDDEATILREGGIPVCASTLDAIAVARALLPVRGPKSQASARRDSIVVDARGALSEHRSKELLRRSGLAFPAERFVKTADEAVKAAGELGYPVVLKATGHGIWHKSELGLVQVGISSENALRAEIGRMQEKLAGLDSISSEGFLIGEMVSEGTEVLIGVTHDAEFGPTLVIGPGGVLAEAFGSAAMRHVTLPTTRKVLNEAFAGSVLQTLLSGFRGGAPGDVEALMQLCLQISDLAEALDGRLLELDLNPVKVGPVGRGALPLDALVVLDG